MLNETLPKSRMIVLNVDDDERGRYVTTRQLQSAGFEVREASTGEEALSMATPEIDVVLLDVNLPDINGFEVCRRLKASSETRALKVVHLSASIIAPKDKALGLNLGADAYLTEPLESPELVATLKSMVRLRRAEQFAIEASRAWEATFNAIRDGVWLLDKNYVVSRCNRAMLDDILGLSADEVIGAPAVDVLDRILNPEQMQKLAYLASNQHERPRERVEVSLAHKWYFVTADQIADDTHGLVQTFADITARKDAEIAAEVAQKAKTEFLANVSHELRTPLSAVLGYSDLLSDPDLTPGERDEFNHTIQRNGKQLGRLIDDLLDISKADEDRLSIESIRLDFRAFLDDLKSSVRLGTETKGIGFSIEALTPLPDYIETDPTRLKQILMNLTSNAIKFTSKGSVDIRISFESEGDKTRLLFLVSDTGIGLSESQQKKIFQPFVQADQSTSRRFGGTGLGLALSKKLAVKLGGDLWLKQSDLGKGSLFALSVAVKRTSRSQMHDNLLENQNLCAMSKDQDAQSLKNVKILLAEDAKDNQWLFGYYLKSAGAQVIIANDGFEAVAKVQAQASEIDMILMDIQMPGLDGYSATERLRATGFTKPIIALTAHALSEDREKCQEVGCTAHLTKPVSREHLIAKVRESIQEATV